MSDIAQLKSKLKKAYMFMRYTKPDYSCGHQLTKHISVEYSEACRSVNTLLDELAKIDPQTPKTRF